MSCVNCRVSGLHCDGTYTCETADEALVTARKAPVEVLQALCEALDAAEPRMSTPLGPRTKAALKAYRVAIAPLRTRAEVDAEIGRELRSSVIGNLACNDCLCPENLNDNPDSNERAKRLRALCAEPTSPDPAPEPSTFTTRHGDVIDLGAEPEVCSCDESEHLIRKLQYIREVCGRYQASCCAGDVLEILDGKRP